MPMVGITLTRVATAMLIGAVLNRSERKKTEILAAARGVFLREGYSAAGM